MVTHFGFRNTCFWIINNSLQGFNASFKAKHFDSYDFSTLYTKIPHVSLKNNLHELIDEAYKARGAMYLAVNKKGICYWANSRGAYMNINKTELVAMIIISLFRLETKCSDNVLGYLWGQIALHC